MGISQYIKEIGRGKDGARAISRTQACDLMTQVLNGSVSDLELGAFCQSMRIKGETPEEMAGFLDAVYQQLPAVPNCAAPTVVLPSYNGARKLPVLTPLLALLLAQAGCRVLVHGQTQDPGRVTAYEVFQTWAGLFDPTGTLFRNALQVDECTEGGRVYFLATPVLSPALQRLLDVRRVIGLRNSAHSLVKLLNPCGQRPSQPSCLVSSYTHPEYLHSMGAVLQLTHSHALLLRGTEGEPVADPRRAPAIDGFYQGQQTPLQAQQAGSLTQLPDLPAGNDANATARYTQAVLAHELPAPTPLTQQVALILRFTQHPHSATP